MSTRQLDFVSVLFLLGGGGTGEFRIIFWRQGWRVRIFWRGEIFLIEDVLALLRVHICKTGFPWFNLKWSIWFSSALQIAILQHGGMDIILDVICSCLDFLKQNWSGFSLRSNERKHTLFARPYHNCSFFSVQITLQWSAENFVLKMKWKDNRVNLWRKGNRMQTSHFFLFAHVAHCLYQICSTTEILTVPRTSNILFISCSACSWAVLKFSRHWRKRKKKSHTSSFFVFLLWCYWYFSLTFCNRSCNSVVKGLNSLCTSWPEIESGPVSCHFFYLRILSMTKMAVPPPPKKKLTFVIESQPGIHESEQLKQQKAIQKFVTWLHWWITGNADRNVYDHTAILLFSVPSCMNCLVQIWRIRQPDWWKRKHTYSFHELELLPLLDLLQQKHVLHGRSVERTPLEHQLIVILWKLKRPTRFVRTFSGTTQMFRDYLKCFWVSPSILESWAKHSSERMLFTVR